MRVLSLRTIHGPSVYHHRPTIVMEIDLEEMTEVPSSDSPEFIERLVKTIPGISQHHCSPGRPGGFVERLKRGTYFAHIIEHICLELSEAAGIGVDFGKAVFGGKEGVYRVIVRFRSEEGMKYLLESSVEVAAKLWRDERVNIDDVLTRARKIVKRSALGPSTEAIIKAAERRNIPWRRLNDDSLIQLGYGKYRKFIQATTTSETSDIAVEIAQDKELTKNILRQASIPVPYGVVIREEGNLSEVIEKLHPPLAVKPLNGNHGRGVSLNVRSIENLREAFHLARHHSEDIIIEEQFEGQDFRVVLVDGKLVAAAHRMPAHITGDGSSSILKLIEIENENPSRGEGHEKPMTLITLDEEALSYLNRQSMTPDFVPEKGKTIYLRETANLSTGGTAEDVTGIVHPDIRFMCERAARIIGLDVCGIDLVLPDISQSFVHQRGGIIEVNAGPGIRMHHYPSSGNAVDVGDAIVRNLFREKSDGRIPIIAVTGTNGKTTVSRLISHVLVESGLNVGTTTTDGICINKQMISEGDTTGPVSARTVLNDPTVAVAVLETARGGIVKRGLGFDWCDVGMITNIEADHFGQDGIESLEDVLWVKSLVIERVKEGGTIVLNADSPEIMNFISVRNEFRDGKRDLIFISYNGMESIAHEKHGLFFKNGSVFELRSQSVSKILDVEDIPMTMKGTSAFNVENIMFTIAGAMALGLSIEAIVSSLKSFRSSDNPGRMNLYRISKGFILLDYGHNPDAFLSIGEMVSSWHMSRVTAVVGVPGDRSDEMVRLSGKAAAHAFNRIIIREDEDLRGRKESEVAGLLKETILNERPEIDLQEIHDPVLSLSRAIEEMKDKEIVVYFYEDMKHVMETLRKYDAVPVDIFALIQPDEEMWSAL